MERYCTHVPPMILGRCFGTDLTSFIGQEGSGGEHGDGDESRRLVGVE